MTIIERNCNYCGLPYSPLNNSGNGNSLYCSPQCKREARLEMKREEAIARGKMRCEVCGTLILRKGINQKYCSKKCAQARGTGRNRFVIFSRDNFRCIYCGRSSIEHEIELHLDHIVPRSRGGDDSAENLVTACSECNISKLDNLLQNDDTVRIKAVIRERNRRCEISPQLKVDLISFQADVLCTEKTIEEKGD